MDANNKMGETVLGTTINLKDLLIQKLGLILNTVYKLGDDVVRRL